MIGKKRRIGQWLNMSAKNVQFPPANGKQGPAALTNKKQANFDLIYADNLAKHGRVRINRKK